MNPEILLRPGLDNWKPTNSQHLEKWLGGEVVEQLSRNMRDFYFPIAVAGVPGNVYAMPGGDFCGKILTSGEASAVDRLGESVRREKLARRAAVHRMVNTRGRGKFSARDRTYNAFASADAVYAAMTGGKAQFFYYAKTGVGASAIGGAMDLWTRASQPVAGAAGAAVPGGTVPTNASTGAIPYVNPASAGTGHFVLAEPMATVINMNLMLIDRLFAAAINPNSTANQAITGVPSRYTSTTPSSLSFCGGNFLFPANPTTVLAGTAHNWVLGGSANGGCVYTDQDGNTGANLPLIAGISACPVAQIDIVVNAPGWFMPLAAGDYGVREMTKVELSAAVATGTMDICIGHPIVMLPHWAALLVCVRDGLRGSFNLAHIEDNACLSMIEMPKAATTATSYSGTLTFCGE
jgi:hypothetical protein